MIQLLCIPAVHRLCLIVTAHAGSTITYNNSMRDMLLVVIGPLELVTARLWIRKTLQGAASIKPLLLHLLYQHAYATYAPGCPSVHGGAWLQRTNVRRHENAKAAAKKKTRSSIMTFSSGSITMIQQTRLPVHISHYGTMLQDMTSAHASPLTT